MAWVTPVTNRTGGNYTYADMNRVGGNVQHLANLLNEYGYLVSVSPKTDWFPGEKPRASGVSLYLLDLNTLKAAFYGTTVLPADMDKFTYTKANSIEKLLEELEEYITGMIATFRYSGTFYAGDGDLI